MKKKKVLLIDDDESISKMLSFFVEEMGYESIEKNDAVSARKWLSSNKPDLIIMDIMLPDITGIEFCRWINSLDTLKDIPIIHMTALVHDEIAREDSMMAGAKAFVTKPVDLDDLKEKIKNILG
jgi:DNA-binding response OmpR family regulator